MSLDRPTRYIRLFQTDRTSKDRLRTNVNLHISVTCDELN